jgi:hypothetical protein
MPLYCFRCECGKSFEKVLSMKDCLKSQNCECGKKAHRDLIAEHRDGTVDSQMREYQFEGEHGTRMYAASYLPNQINEARKVHPGTDFKLRNGCYIPVIKNRNHKLKYLREMGYVEKD